MGKFSIFLLSISLFTSLSCGAAVYKGQREFVKRCVECHTAGQEFILTKKIREWERLLGNNGKRLAQLHIKSDKKEAKNSHEYFNDEKFAAKSKHLKQFLIEYAKDSGNVPACN